jgi:hypothetical protein
MILENDHEAAISSGHNGANRSRQWWAGGQETAGGLPSETAGTCRQETAGGVPSETASGLPSETAGTCGQETAGACRQETVVGLRSETVGGWRRAGRAPAMAARTATAPMTAPSRQTPVQWWRAYSELATAEPIAPPAK